MNCDIGKKEETQSVDILCNRDLVTVLNSLRVLLLRVLIKASDTKELIFPPHSVLWTWMYLSADWIWREPDHYCKRVSSTPWMFRIDQMHSEKTYYWLGVVTSLWMSLAMWMHPFAIGINILLLSTKQRDIEIVHTCPYLNLWYKHAIAFWNRMCWGKE